MPPAGDEAKEKLRKENLDTKRNLNDVAREKDAINQANEELRDKIKKNEAERIQLKRNVDDQSKKLGGKCDRGRNQDNRL